MEWSAVKVKKNRYVDTQTERCGTIQIGEKEEDKDEEEEI